MSAPYSLLKDTKLKTNGPPISEIYSHTFFIMQKEAHLRIYHRLLIKSHPHFSIKASLLLPYLQKSDLIL